jgi:serine/threonine-protein kinase
MTDVYCRACYCYTVHNFAALQEKHQPVSTSAASIPAVSSGSYARIKNPRVVRIVRVVGLGLFAVGIVAGLLSVPADYAYWQTTIAKISPLSLKIYADLGLSVQAIAFYRAAWDYAYAVAFTGVGLLIYLRRSDDWVAIAIAVVLLSQGLFQIIPSSSPIFILFRVPPAYLVFPVICIFPDGHFQPKWSRWLVPPYIIIATAEVLEIYDRAAAFPVIYLILVLFWCLAAAFQVRRIRQTTDPAQRQQLKLFFSGVLIAILGVASSAILAVFIGGSAGVGEALNYLISPWLFYGGGIVFLALMTFSILRYRLWDIDLVINRSLVYGGLAVGLGIVFILALLILQGVLQAVLGSQQTTLAAMISGGAVALLFNPTRLWLQHLVDRRVFGLRMDLHQVAEAEKKPAPIKGESLIGRQIGAFEINDLIGRGGMGEVYLATQSSLGRQVALKVLPAHLSSDLEFRIRFEREARIVASLHHANIINIFDFGEIEGLYYMAMEYVQGQDLGALLRERKVLPLEEALPVITQVAEALDYAHSQGVVHRDIKPSNVMLRRQSSPTARPHPLLMDFGLTKLLGGETGLTQSNVIGTLSYTAPEQIAASGKVDHRADVYSFGVMCYELLTGKLPFRDSSQAALLFAHLQRPAPDPRQFNPALPESVASALLGTLEKLPAMRPSSAGEFATQLSTPVLQAI